jgi:uncharacterized SAM-binding protein YcdF (DUF218 family)
MSSRRRLSCGLLLSAAAMVLLWTTHDRLLCAMARWLDVGEQPQHAEYAMVLNGDENTRPFVAAALVNAGLAKHVLVTEVIATPLVADQIIPPYHEINRQVLLRRGVPADRISILPAQAATTFDEANALAAFLKDRPNASVLIVTNDCHTRRSRWAFARVLAGGIGRVSFVSAPTDQFSMDRWWQNEEGFVTIVTEYLKLAFYAVRYGYFGYWLGACCALALVARRIGAAYGMRTPFQRDG